MVYAVSDRAIRGAPTRGARIVARPRHRVAPSVTIHWPRVIALGVNVLIWVTIIAAIMHALRR